MVPLVKQKIIPFLLILWLIIMAGCNIGGSGSDSGPIKPSKPKIKRDLAQIKESGVLKAITIFSPTSYFLYRGQPMGFEYDLLNQLAGHLDLELQIVVAEDLDDMFGMLNRGEGDIVAYGMTITEARRKSVDFTTYHFESHQVLVQRKPSRWREMKLHEIERELIRNPVDLIGKTVHVRRGTAYYERLKNLSQEIGGEIVIAPVKGNITTDEIVAMVAEGQIDYTVADNNIASLNQTYYPILDVQTPISFSQRNAWAVRKNSPELLRAVNEWIAEMKQKSEYYVIYDKYFKNKKLYKKRIGSEFNSETSGKISRYDDLIRSLSDSLGWDWRLLSSIVYQESRFDPQATSWAGGSGLMQLMPSTAEEMGLQDTSDPDENLQAGVAYLKELWERWEDVRDPMQRIKFTLASYNCGYHHVLDARKLADKNNADADQWDDGVEDYILKLSNPEYYRDEVVEYGYVRGLEPYEYVREIFERYEHYKQLIPFNAPREETVSSQERPSS